MLLSEYQILLPEYEMLLSEYQVPLSEYPMLLTVQEKSLGVIGCVQVQVFRGSKSLTPYLSASGGNSIFCPVGRANSRGKKSERVTSLGL